MTSEQVARQRRSQVRTKAGKDRVLLALAESPWGSAKAYAPRLGVTPTMFYFYRTDRYALPRNLAEMIREDLGIPLSYWKRVVD